MHTHSDVALAGHMVVHPSLIHRPHALSVTLAHMITHAHVDHALKLAHKRSCVALVARPTPWPEVSCLSPSYAHPTNVSIPLTHTLAPRYTHVALVHPHPRNTHLACVWFPLVTFSHSHMPLAHPQPPLPWWPAAHTHCMPSLRIPCMLRQWTPCTPLELTLPFCSSAAPRYLHTPPTCSCTPLPTSHL